jgi:hypothetical protein
MLEKSRQAVDSGLRDGRIPGFQDPDTSRLWVERDWVEDHAPGSRHFRARLDALEAAAGLTPPSGVAAENLTLRSMNLQLLAALDAYADFAKHVEKAEQFEDKARRQRRRASAALHRASENFREGLSQANVPGSIGEMDP